MKIIRVNKCEECPHRGEFAYHSFCQPEDKDIDNPDTIPEWCPLEEEEK